MTHKTRRLIFYIFLVLFIVVASTIILYAQGYSFDLQKKSLVITGAFYFKSYPKEADIYINNRYHGTTNKFIKRVLPGEYDIRISRSGYYDWQKTLGIKSKLVTEAQNIFLVKKELLLNSVTDNNVKYLSFSPDKKWVAYLTDKMVKEVSTYSQFAIRLMNVADNTDIQIYPASSVEGKKVALSIPRFTELSDISWSDDNKKLLLSFPNNRYYILNLKNPFEIVDINNIVKTLSNYKIYSIENLSFHPQDSNKIYFYSGNSLYFVEINSSYPSKSSLSSPILSNILTYTIYNNKILYINTDGEFYKTNLETSSFKKIFDIPIFESEQSITIINDELLMLKKDLYFLNSQTQVFEKISESIEEITFSDDGKKIFWRTKKEIGIIWLESESKQPQRNKNEIEIILEATEDVNQVIWYSKTNQYLIFVTGDKINITELDDRDKRNTTNIFTIKNPKIFYSKEDEKLYILSEEKLYWIKLAD